MVSLWEIDAPRAWSVWTPRGTVAQFIMDFLSTIHSYIQNKEALGFVVSDKIDAPRVVINLEIDAPRWWSVCIPRDTGGTIYNEDYQKLLHTKYKSSGP